MSRTKTIFVGTLLQKVFRTQKEDGDVYKVHFLTFRIDEKLRGVPAKTHLIQYWERITRRSSCDTEPPDPKVGEQWVVYDGYDEGGNTSLNVGNPEFLNWQFKPEDSHSRKELTLIKDAIANPRSTLFGEVEMAMFDTPPDDEDNIKVELLDYGQSAVIAIAAVKKGRFSFPNLLPGTYAVRLRSSKHYNLFHPESVEMEKDRDDRSYIAGFKIQIRPALPEYMNFALAIL